MILKNGRVVPYLCEGAPDEVVDLRIEGDKIAEILPAGGNYTGEEVIDCTGKTILPGLYNLHMHANIDAFDWFTLYHRPEQISTIISARYVRTLLAYGYTTIRDVGCVYEHAINLRNMINDGSITGPNMTASGYILTPNHPEVTGCYSQYYTIPADGVEGVRNAVRRELAAGADFIKILGSQAKGTHPYPLFNDEEMAELAKEVRDHHTYLAVHTTSPESLDSAIRGNAKTIEHAMYMTNDQVDRIAAHPDMHIVMTAACTRSFDPTEGYQFTKECLAGIRNAFDAGILIGFGSDSDYNTFIKMPCEEFVDRNEILGYDKKDIMQMATITSARINGEGDKRGSIKAGKIADLAIFNGKPDEDFYIFDKPADLVIKSGEVVAIKGCVKP